ncbi:hypothetical protein Ccrd_026052 [Cynara cardunculus var. scolymus]|uniref:Uncharacterized protein n=1 Tax=Cynara cardunculus var. scolymus TaxID=59895 RepID=A0A103XDE2_CYNCS|nr:hypothetical protein Ccrd_026052 [Cynara cardunculus var. scolymus]
MATRAAGMMFHCVFEGSLSMSEMDKEQRPYHKNCNCACIRQNMKPQELVPIMGEFLTQRNHHGTTVR